MTCRLVALALSSALIACTPTDGTTTDGASDSSSDSTAAGSTGDTSSATSDGSATTDGSASASASGSTTGASDPTTGGGSTGGTSDATTGGAAPSFATDVWPIFMVSCSCHTGMTPGPPTGLTMGNDAASAFAALVNAPSSVPNLDEVEPGSSDKSYLYHKLAGTQASVGGGGTQMPPGGMLGAADLATVQAWIDGGALE